MPQLGVITINDGQATPVAHNFSPVRIDEKGVATFFDRSGGIAIGFPRLTVSLREPVERARAGMTSDTKRNYRCVITIDRPTLDTTSTVPTVAHIHSSRLQLDMPEAGTEGERKDLIAYNVNGLNSVPIGAVIKTLESFY